MAATSFSLRITFSDAAMPFTAAILIFRARRLSVALGFFVLKLGDSINQLQIGQKQWASGE